MAYKNYRQVMAIKMSNESRIKKICPDIQDKPGIYFFYRQDELGILHGYVGQATNSVLSRCAEHLSGYQYIDLSIRKHKLVSNDNPYGWKLKIEGYESDKDKLNEYERKYILHYAKTHQLKNVLSGGQDGGRIEIGETKAKKGYREGIKQGEENTRKFIANLFEKHLNVSTKSDTLNKNQEKALEKFNNFLKGEEEK